MHAYLLVGTGNADNAVSSLAKKLKAKILRYDIQKISDVRDLNNLVRLSLDGPTLIVSKNVHEASEEALNAFLKNLEEPQENLYFALIAPGVRRVLPTIVSRCQIIKSTKNPITRSTDFEGVEKFLSMSVGQKLSYIDKVRDREKAIEFAESTVQFLHGKLHENGVKYSMAANNIEAVEDAISGLKKNGNVNLQLTNFVIKYA